MAGAAMLLATSLLQHFSGIISEISLMIAIFIIFYLNCYPDCFTAVKSKAIPGVM